ncbi:cytochrome c family protein [bacterium]|nr:cytochrome c family protein [bacterium]
MAQIFSKRMNRILPELAMGGVLFLAFATFFFWYWGSPKYTDVGYRPEQPVKFSHKLHAGDLGMDCRYCHTNVEVAEHANIPSTETCMNCHTLIGIDNPKVAPIRESWNTGEPIEWVRVHMLPDYAYFAHGPHIQAGVSCIECHGNVREMEVVTQVEPLSMGWCLECHRNPDDKLRPVSEITNMQWTPPTDHAEFVAQWKTDKNIKPPEDCSACHR